MLKLKIIDLIPKQQVGKVKLQLQTHINDTYK